MLSKTKRVSFAEWHPKVTDELWERLSRGTKWNRFRERGLDTKDYLNANGTEEIKYKDALEYFLDKYRVAFAMEHFVADQGLD